MSRRPPRDPLANPVGMAILRTRIRADLDKLLNSADLHAWFGDAPARLVNDTGRLVYIVLGAAEAAGMSGEEPDIRIVLGMGEALGDLQADRDLERHRPSIRSGIEALRRLMPRLDVMDLAVSSIRLDQKLHTTQSMGTADLRAMFPTTTPA